MEIKKTQVVSIPGSELWADGNAFAIMGKVKIAMKRAKLIQEWNEYREEATSGDYDHLIQTTMKWVDDSEIEEDEF